MVNLVTKWFRLLFNRSARSELAPTQGNKYPPKNNRKRLNREDVLRIIHQATDRSLIDFSNADMRGIDLDGLNLDGIKFGDRASVTGADLSWATMKNSSLKETDLSFANLSNAKAYSSDLTYAIFYGADCSNTDFRRSNLTKTDFYRTNLSTANLSQARLLGVNWYLAKLDHTIFQRKDLGGRLLLEIDSFYLDYYQRLSMRIGKKDASIRPSARLFRTIQIYEAFSANWQSVGQPRDATWAYLKMRKLGKHLHLPKYARHIFGETELNDISKKIDGKRTFQGKRNFHPKVLLFYFRHILLWLGDWLVELLCNYGESIWRVLFWIITIILFIGPALIWSLGGLAWTGDNIQTFKALSDPFQKALYYYFQYVIYMIDTITTANFAEMKPNTDLVRLVSGLMSLIGIFLAGLLGFVAGNRIRHS